MKPPKKWRGERSIVALMSQMERAISASTDGATVTITIGTARSTLDVMSQARWTEHAQTAPQDRCYRKGEQP